MISQWKSWQTDLNERFALQLQALASSADQVLVIGDLLSGRTVDGCFAASEVTDAFYALNVPPPKNVGTMFAALRRRSFLLQQPGLRWSITPIGKQAVADIGVQVAQDVQELMVAGDGAEFAHVDHSVIPSWAAPPRWQVGIRRLQERFPFERNVFCMTRFPSEGDAPDPVDDAIDMARDVLAEYGLVLHLATDAIVEEDLFGNVGAYMWACRYGMAIVEDRMGQGLNHNAIIEVGGMIVTGRRCTILKDNTVQRLPTDLAGQIYRPIDLGDLDTVGAALRHWAGDDLGLYERTA